MIKISKSGLLLLKLCLGIIIVFIVYSKIGVLDIIETILSLNIVFLTFYLLLKALSFSFSALNVALTLKPLRYKVSVKNILRFSILSWSLGLFAPAKLGELSLVYFLKKKGVPIGKGFTIFFIDRILTLLVLFSLGIFAIIFLVPSAIWVYLLLFLALFFAVTIFLRYDKFINIFLKKVLKKYSIHLEDFYATLTYYVREHSSYLFLNLVVTYLKWFFTAFSIMVLFWAFGIDIPYFKILVIQSAITIVTLLPVTFNGIGVTEPVGIYLYSLVGIPLTISASMFAVGLVGTYLLGLVFLLLFFRK
jgi:glycosyltransferase 2 family protein